MTNYETGPGLIRAYPTTTTIASQKASGLTAVFCLDTHPTVDNNSHHYIRHNRGVYSQHVLASCHKLGRQGDLSQMSVSCLKLGTTVGSKYSNCTVQSAHLAFWHKLGTTVGYKSAHFFSSHKLGTKVGSTFICSQHILASCYKLGTAVRSTYTVCLVSTFWLLVTNCTRRRKFWPLKEPSHKIFLTPFFNRP